MTEIQPLRSLERSTVEALMKAKALDRADLCAKLGVSQSYLSRLLNHHVPLSPRILSELARVLQAKPESLVGVEERSQLRVAIPPHLWSAPLLNAELAGRSLSWRGDLPRGALFTGRDAVDGLRRGGSDAALAFDAALESLDDSRVAVLGSICIDRRCVRLLVRRGPLLEHLVRSGCTATAHGSPYLGAPVTIAFRPDTIAGSYVRSLERTWFQGVDLDQVQPQREAPWLDATGRPLDAIVTWDPLASALVAKCEGELVDLFDELGAAMPEAGLPSLAEYKILLDRGYPITRDDLRLFVRDLNDVLREFNHYARGPKMTLQKQPFLECLCNGVEFRLEPAQRRFLERLLAEHVRSVGFELRLRPETVTSEFL